MAVLWLATTVCAAWACHAGGGANAQSPELYAPVSQRAATPDEGGVASYESVAPYPGAADPWPNRSDGTEIASRGLRDVFDRPPPNAWNSAWPLEPGPVEPRPVEPGPIEPAAVGGFSAFRPVAPGTEDRQVSADLIDRLTAVTQGRVQIEMGYAYSFDRAAGLVLEEHTVPDMLLRVGLTERLEFRLGWPGYYASVVSGGGPRSVDQRVLAPNLGAMFDVCPQQGWIPQTAVLAAAPVTLDGNSALMGSLQPLSQALYCWYPTERFSLGGTTGVALFTHRGDHYVQLQQSIQGDYLLGDRWATFLEATALIDVGSANDGVQTLLESGVSWLCTQRLQLNWRVGVGLNDRAPDFLTGLRCSLRF